ncbi:CBS domain-containing protein [Muricauda sp. JGD-17]|uniref:CBS domain-containing protein n=1 Tax=Flagellimonas ochracea TaxID=2696472 RepID=A0A964T902_9FLAO|nr:CBS domain-containing protein [Allomuricauda ochracea]NAY90433.1 CBS domain-containing protein [Allomuricauda ochracea]
MKKSIPISEIMTKNVITLSLGDDLVTAEERFKKNRIRHIPVVEDKHVVGMLSYTDLLRISFADAVGPNGESIEDGVYDMFTLSQVMVHDVVSVTPQTTIKDVAKFLSQREFHALPVIDNDELVGIVTTTDLINYLLEL